MTRRTQYSPQISVRCASCPLRSRRIRREDGTFGRCTACGGELSQSDRQADARRQHAKADLERFYPQGPAGEGEAKV